MRTIGVVPELGVDPGIYHRSSVDPAKVHLAWTALSTGSIIKMSPLNILIILIIRMITPKHVNPIVRLEDAKDIIQSDNRLINLKESITILSRTLNDVYSDHSNKVFHGLFKSEKMLKASMDAFGGNGYIQIVSQETANKFLKRAGGSTFAPGLYIPHPKNPDLLLPIDGYNDEIKAEIKAEIHEILALLKARSVIFAQKISHEITATAQGAGPIGSYKAKIEAKYGESNTSEMKFSKPSFQPHEALKGRLWLGDNREIKSLVDNLIKTHPESYEFHSKIDIALEGALDILNIAFHSKNKGSVRHDGKLEFTFRADFFE